MYRRQTIHVAFMLMELNLFFKSSGEVVFETKRHFVCSAIVQVLRSVSYLLLLLGITGWLKRIESYTTWFKT